MELPLTGQGSATSTSASGTRAFPHTPFNSGDVLVVVAFSTVTQTTLSLSGGGATWTRVVGESSSGSQFIQVWIAWGFDVTSVATTYSWSRTGTTQIGFIEHQFRFPAPVSSQPTVTNQTPATGTSTAPASPTQTPAVDDLLFEVAMWANATASSARSDSQGAGIGSVTGTALALTANRVETAFRKSDEAATAMVRTWTITSAAWIALGFRLTPSATAGAGAADTADFSSLPNGTEPADVSWVYKGRALATDDTGSNGVV